MIPVRRENEIGEIPSGTRRRQVRHPAKRTAGKNSGGQVRSS
jgi:hypothetical protein